jgi:hypothetical protein
MYFTRQHLVSIGFKPYQVDYEARKGGLTHLRRLYNGGTYLYTIEDILALAKKLNVTIDKEEIGRLNHGS